MKRFYTLVLILALMFAFTASAFAQDTACGDLSDEDCDILYSSSDAMKMLTSGSSSVTVDFEASNIPTTPYESLAFDWSLDTTYSYSDEAADAAMSMQEMSPEEVAALYSDAGALTELVTTILAGTSTSVEMNSNFSEELANLLGASSGMAWPASFALNMVLDSGVAYIDMSTLGPLMGGDDMAMSGWIGFEILPYVEMGLMQSTTDPTTALAASASTQTGAGPLYTQLAAADPGGVITPFLTIERTDDGADVATFVTSVDWTAFVNSPYFEQLITMALMQDGETPSAADIEQTVTLGRMFGPTLLQGITLELVENIAVDTGYLESTEFTLDWDLSDLAALSAMAGGGELDIDENAAISLSIVTANSDLNEDIEIEVPEAQILSAEDLMGQQ